MNYLNITSGGCTELCGVRGSTALGQSTSVQIKLDYHGQKRKGETHSLFSTLIKILHIQSI